MKYRSDRLIKGLTLGLLLQLSSPHSHAYSIGRIMCCNFIVIGSPSSFSKVKPGDSEASTLDNKTGLMCTYELSLWSPALLISLTDLQIIVGIAH